MTEILLKNDFFSFFFFLGGMGEMNLQIMVLKLHNFHSCIGINAGTFSRKKGKFVFLFYPFGVRPWDLRDWDIIIFWLAKKWCKVCHWVLWQHVERTGSVDHPHLGWHPLSHLRDPIILPLPLGDTCFGTRVSRACP